VNSFLQQTARRPHVNPLLIDGFVYLFDAVDFVGKQTLGGEWTGDELFAPSLNCISADVPRPHLQPLPLGMVGTNQPLRSAEPLWVLDGRLFKTKEAAEAKWAEVAEARRADAELKRAARLRFERIRELMLVQLAHGTKEAFRFDPATGRETGTWPVECWRSDVARAAFEFGNRFVIVRRSDWITDDTQASDSPQEGEENDDAPVVPTNRQKNDFLTFAEQTKKQCGLGPTIKQSTSWGNERERRLNREQVRALREWLKGERPELIRTPGGRDRGHTK